MLLFNSFSCKFEKKLRLVDTFLLEDCFLLVFFHILENLDIGLFSFIEEKSDSIGGLVEDAVEKGKDFIEDLKTKDI